MLKSHRRVGSFALSLAMLFSLFSVAGPASAEEPSESVRNVALRRAAYHSSAADYNQTGHLITDGIIDSDSFDSSWVSAGDVDESVYVDLGAKSIISSARIYWGENYATSYKLQVSLDAENWTTVLSAQGKGGVEEVSFDPQQTKYVRLLCETSSGKNFIVKELEVYGSNDLHYSIGDMPAPEADGTQYLRGGNWKVQRVSEVDADGAALSQAGYDDSSWLPATVPGTVLTSYQNAGAIADGNFDDNQLQISDSFFTADFWYRDHFTIPESQQGQKVWLNFDAINWKADVYFNGENIGRIKGAFTRAKFDVTDLANIGGENYLAVYIHKNDTPGAVTQQDLSAPGSNGGALGADNPTIHASIGWDWVPTIRGRNIGIYNDVFISYSQDVQLKDPWMITDLALNEQPSTTYVNEAIGASATASSGDAASAVDGDTETKWSAASKDGETLVIDLKEEKTFQSVLITWGEAGYWNSNHAAVFHLEGSHDGSHWEPIAMNQNGSTDGSDAVSLEQPVTFRYVRFTSVERYVSGYGGDNTVISELGIYDATEDQLFSGKRVYDPDFSKADLTFKTQVSNTKDQPVTANVSGTIQPGNIPFSQEVELAAGEVKDITIDGIVLEDPELWWPNTYGEQYLYTATVDVSVDGVESDSTSFQFGVREFTYPQNASNQLMIYCNGTRIICRGGNWGMDDANLTDTAEDYDIKVRLHAEENFTMIRNWVGMTNNRAFYDACDKYGLLIWDDFWLANPSDGPSPTDNDMFMANARDKIARNRYHASLALYCGRNEGNPPQPLYDLLPQAVDEVDGTRFYVQSSNSSPVGSGGGYALKTPKQSFQNAQNTVLRSEIGIPNIPSEESIRRFIDKDNLWPINDVWGLHDFCLGGAMNGSTFIFNGPAKYLGYEDVNSVSFEDFVRASQMVNYESHKGLLEGNYVYGSNGALMWMSASAWPSFVWQTYDYFYDCNAAYFGLKTGNQPINAIWNPLNEEIVLSNATAEDLNDVEVQVELYDLNGKLLSQCIFPVDRIVSDSFQTITTLQYPEDSTDMKFLKTYVKSGDEILGENFYWLNSKNYQEYTALNSLSNVDLTASYKAPEQVGTTRYYEVTVKNDGDTPALLARIKAMSGDDLILPTFYEDNYFSLMPGDSKTIKVEFNEKYMQDPSDFRFELEGFNVVEKQIGEDAPAYAIKSTSIQDENGLVWNVDSGNFRSAVEVQANADGAISITPVIAIYKNGVLFDIAANPQTIEAQAGNSYTVYSDYASIPFLGEYADLSMYSIKAYILGDQSQTVPLYGDRNLGDWINNWEPLPYLNDQDRVSVDSFDDYEDDSKLNSQYGQNSGRGSSNSIQLVDSPFSDVAGEDLGKALKFQYTLVNSHTGRARSLPSEFDNMEYISFWYQGPANVFMKSKDDTEGDNLILQMYSKGASYEVNFFTLAERGYFDPTTSEPQFIEFPLSLITPKNTTPDTTDETFDVTSVSNFGLFINTNGRTVHSPADSIIYLDDVRMTRRSPIFDRITRQYAGVGEAITFQTTAKVMDEDGYYVDDENLVYSLVDIPEGVIASIDDNGLVSFSAHEAGTYTLTLKAAVGDFSYTTQVPVTVD